MVTETDDRADLRRIGAAAGRYGHGFFIGNWLSLLVLTAGAAVGLVYRIKVEERALLGDLGERYRDDAATRKRLIPFVW